MGLKTITSISSSAPSSTVTSNASANTLSSSFATLGTTAEQWDYIFLQIRTNATANRDFLLQLYTNDSGSDTVLGDPIPIRLQSAAKLVTFGAFVRIPSGTVIKAKCMDSTGSGVLIVVVMGMASGSDVRQGAATGANAWKFIGTPASTASSAFTVCDGGAVANTFTSTTLGSTTMDANALGFMTRVIVSANTAAQLRLLDDGAQIVGNTTVMMVNGDNFQVNYGPFPMSATIASGSSLAAEVSCSGTLAGSREIGVVAYIQNLPALSGGGGSTTIINGGGVQRMLKDGEVDAGRKTIPLDIRTSAGAIYNANGETCRIKVGTGAWGNATNTIVGTADGNEITLTDAEAASASPGDLIQVYCDDTVNHLASPISVFEVGAFDPTASTVDANLTSILGTAGATTELSAVPAVNASFWDMLKWMFYKSRNKITQTSATQTLLKDDGSTTLATSTTSDDGTTATRGEFV